MDQKVKLQISTDIEDVTKISSITLEDALQNLTRLTNLVIDLKRNLSGLDISIPEHRETLKHLLNDFDSGRMFLSKIDMRLGDVASIVSGLSSIFEGKPPSQEEEKDDNVSSG